MDNLEELLEDIEDVKRFGEDLGLEFQGAFTELDMSIPPSLYWLYVSFPDRIEAPDIRHRKGRPPYLFYKHKSSARRRQKQLDAEGYDTLLFEGSGAGIGNCPITKSLLNSSRRRRIEVVLHEGFHINRYSHDVEDSQAERERIWYLPYRLDEAIATVGGILAASQYAQERGNDPALIESFNQRMQWWQEFTEFINKYHAELTECYGGGGDSKEIFARAQEEAEKLSVSGFIPNNAFFLRQSQYTRDTPLVYEVFKDLDLRDYLADPAEVHARLLKQIGKEKD